MMIRHVCSNGLPVSRKPVTQNRLLQLPAHHLVVAAAMQHRRPPRATTEIRKSSIILVRTSTIARAVKMVWI